jgi:hypothetical protein
LKILKTIFPNASEDDKFTILKISSSVLGIQTTCSNDVLGEIVKSINNYLGKNKGAASDFHLIKNIVDRHCDAQEDEINTQIPVPLYLGLMGTMAGIIVGLGFLVVNGGINSISNDPQNINLLLGGVALAMVTSIIGIILTTSGSLKFKESKSVAEKSKNRFLSWIQGELLPNLPTDMSGALVKMSQNLASFNNSFVSNAKELQEAIMKINESYKLHTKLIDAIDKLKIKEIATANIEMYDKLTVSIAEIKQLGSCLSGINVYLSNSLKYIKESDEEMEMRKTAFKESIKIFDNMIQQMFSELVATAGMQIKEFTIVMQNQAVMLTQAVDGQVKLGEGLISRTVGELDKTTGKYVSQLVKSAEIQMNEFIHITIEQTKTLNKAINEQQDTLIENLHKIFDVLTKTFDSTIQNFVSRLKENSETQVSEFQNAMNAQTEMLKESIENQQTALNEKLQETSELVTELKNLTAVKTSMQNLEKATSEQNEKIDKLAEAIRALVQSQQIAKNPDVQVQIFSKRQKTAIITVISILSVSALSLVILFVVKHFM